MTAMMATPIHVQSGHFDLHSYVGNTSDSSGVKSFHPEFGLSGSQVLDD